MKKVLKRMNVKGFTLIEVLGVIVIMGLILIVAIPTMSKLMNNNKSQEYNSYYSTVQEAAQVYAGKLGSKLGNSKYSGCAEIELSTLINEGYVEAYSDNDVTCTTASGGTDYKIKIRNNKGNISVNFRLICTNNETGEIEYDTGTDSADTNSCDAYVMAEEINLKTQLDGDESLSKETPADSNITYITGTNPNNYIWYSGKMWRIVSYNSSTDAVKAVTVNPIASIYYNSSSSTGNSSFSGSDIETWLNNDFLTTLKDQQSFLTSYNWNYTSNTDMNTNSSNSSSYKKLKVGLITTYEYGRIKGWYGTGDTWVLSEGTDGKSVYVTDTGISTTLSTEIHSVRPTVVFSSDVLVYDGTGSATDPYIVDDSANAKGSSNDLINTRYSGEYVKLNNKKYRIVSTNGGVTKIISMYNVGTYAFDAIDGYYLYSSSDLKTQLESNFTSISTYLTSGDLCLDTINNDNLTYRSSSCLTSTRLVSGTIGLPKIGDLFTTSIPGVTNNYWTLNPNTETDETGQAYDSTINTITTKGGTSTSKISETNATVVILYLDSSVKIDGGSGTSSSPYTLKK